MLAQLRITWRKSSLLIDIQILQHFADVRFFRFYHAPSWHIERIVDRLDSLWLKQVPIRIGVGDPSIILFQLEKIKPILL